MDPVTERLKSHYRERFAAHGATALGVDWPDEAELELRYEKMLSVIRPEHGPGAPTLLDVGCGFGGLFGYAHRRGTTIEYIGVDVVPEMIDRARVSYPDGTFHCADVLDWRPDRSFDYVVCNGILTQKLATSIRDMDRFAQTLIRRMFELASVGIAFNVMTTRVDYTKENLYHRHPAELLSWCLAEITDTVLLDHAYPLYEYCVYLYRDPGPRRRALRSAARPE